MAKKQPKPQSKAPEPESPMGRPSDYRPEYAREAFLLCQLGATDAQLADAFEVTVRTVNRWKVTHRDFSEAMRRGKESADDRVEDSLYHKALGAEYEKDQPIKVKKITFNDKGKKVSEEEKIEIVKVKEVIPPDTTAMIFWLKNRRKDQWRDIQKHEHGKPGDFDAVTDEELAAHIAEQTKELAEMDPEFAAQIAAKRSTKH